MFSTVLFWIIIAYLCYYAGLIAWEFYRNKKMGMPVSSTTEVFDPHEEMKEWVEEADFHAENEPEDRDWSASPQERSSDVDSLLDTVIHFADGLSCENLITRLEGAGKEGDTGINMMLDDLGVEWSRANKISA